VERVVGRIGTSAHGVVTRAELLRAGVTAAEIEQRLRTGGLIRAYRGVYRVGHRAPSLEARYLAAVLACGEGALLCDRAAGYLFGALKGLAPPPEVTAPTERRVKGVKTHRTRRMDARDATTFRGVPVTTLPRTLVDLAAVLGVDELARAFHEAEVRHRTTPAQVESALARRPNSRGASKLRAVLYGDAPILLSRLEKRFLALLRAASLPLPEANRRAGGHWVDCRWPEARLTVELDSYRYHHSRHAWEQDRRREREARARGDEFRRYTWADVYEQPQLMMAELRVLLQPGREAPPARSGSS
jgi:predicted transcriptional regulator of viral defense system